MNGHNKAQMTQNKGTYEVFVYFCGYALVVYPADSSVTANRRQSTPIDTNQIGGM